MFVAGAFGADPNGGVGGGGAGGVPGGEGGGAGGAGAMGGGGHPPSTGGGLEQDINAMLRNDAVNNAFIMCPHYLEGVELLLCKTAPVMVKPATLLLTQANATRAAHNGIVVPMERKLGFCYSPSLLEFVWITQPTKPAVTRVSSGEVIP
jgi:hypothetical protein